MKIFKKINSYIARTVIKKSMTENSLLKLKIVVTEKAIYTYIIIFS